jgi:hypothetical protein
LQTHLLEIRGLRCPFFEEVLVAYCRACPIKKMIPSDRVQADCICTREGFEDCPLFREVVAKLEGLRTTTGTAEAPPPAGPRTPP